MAKIVCYTGEYIKAKDTGRYYKVLNAGHCYGDHTSVLAYDLRREKEVRIPVKFVERLDRAERKIVETLYGIANTDLV